MAIQIHGLPPEGTRVQVRDFAGRLLDRVVTAANQAGVMVTTEAEYGRSRAEDREPLDVGFPWRDVFLDSPEPR
jgi:hypothetical protein